MKLATKRLIQSGIRRMGYHIGRITPSNCPTTQLLKGLEHFGVDLVFDVGANRGQFAAALLSAGFKGRIVSFEPLTDAHQALVEAAASCDRWIAHPRMAVGDADGELEFNVAGNSVSSSALPMLDSHTAAASGSAYVNQIKVPVVRLDSVAANYQQNRSPFLIKIDTQGFESRVLDGAPETLAQATGVLCELSLVPLYEGQQLWLDLIARLASAGFTLWSLQNGFTDQRNGRTLQVNATFFRAGDQCNGDRLPYSPSHNNA